MISFSLIVFLAVIFFISYFKVSKNLLYPANILIIGFIIASICNLIIMLQVKSDISLLTLFLILLFVSLFLFFSIVGYRKIQESISAENNKVEFIRIKYWKIFLIIIFQIFAITCFVFKFKQMLGTINSETLAAYRFSVSYTENKSYEMPSWIMFFCNIAYITSYVSVYVLINNIHSKIKDIKMTSLLWFSVFLSLVIPIIESSRFNDITLIIYSFSLLMFFEYKQFNSVKKTLIKSIISLIILFLGFKLLGNLIGRPNQRLEFIYYFGGGISLFDSYIRNGFPIPSNHIGILTLNNFYKLLSKVHVVNFDYNIGFPFRNINGTQIGNVYSCLIAYYHDFGVWGVAVLSSIFGYIFGLTFKYINYLKINKINIFIIIYFYLTFTLVLSPYSEFISNTLLSAGFYINILWIYFISKLFTLNKIPLRNLIANK